MKGYVYILINSSFQNLIKIGRTTKTPQIRSQELSSTGTPGRFIVAYSVHVDDCVEIESLMHKTFATQRHTTDREFFELECSDAIEKLIEISKERLIAKQDSIIFPISKYRLATFYLIRINESRNIFRIGLIDKPSAYLYDSDFKDSIIELYTHWDNKIFYDIKVIEKEELNDLDDMAIEQMRNIIDNNVLLIKANSPIISTGKYDNRTIIINAPNDSKANSIYTSTLSLLEPIVKASFNRKSDKIRLQSEQAEKKILEEKIRKIEYIK